jgi:hypothetical protein
MEVEPGKREFHDSRYPHPDAMTRREMLAVVFSNPRMSLKEAKGRRSGFCPFGF